MDTITEPLAGQSERSVDLPDVGVEAPICIECTHIQSATPVSKQYRDESGVPVKAGRDLPVYSGTARRLAFTGSSPFEVLTQVATSLETYGPSDVLALGSLPPGKDAYSLVTSKLLPFNDGAIARTKEHIQHRGGPCLICSDFDFPKDQQGLASGGPWAALVRAVPQLASAARLARVSMSAAVRNKNTGNYATTAPNLHVYAIARNSGDIPRLAELVQKRLILAGECHPFVSAAGIFECRAIVDRGAMVGAERLFYEGAPTLLHEDLEYDAAKRKPIVLPGEMIDVRSLPDLTADEEKQVEAIIEEMRRRPEVQREIEEKKAIARALQIERSGGRYAPSPEDYDRVLATGELSGNYPILLDDGTTVTADDIATAPWKFHRVTCPDPLDPDYGRGKAMIFAGGKGAPYINSFAHGGSRHPVLASHEAKVRMVAGWFERVEPKPTLRPLAFKLRDSTSIPPRQWLYAGHYIRGFYSVTVAPGGTGKTSFTMVEALAMATGRQLLHYRPHRRCRVWLHNGEDPLGETERRVTAAALEFNIEPAELDGWLFIIRFSFVSN